VTPYRVTITITITRSVKITFFTYRIRIALLINSIRFNNKVQKIDYSEILDFILPFNYLTELQIFTWFIF